MKIKKIICAVAAFAFAAVAAVSATACSKSEKIYVDTNAFFAPFEYYDGNEIVGVDVDIMNQVGKKLGKEVVFTNTDFGVIIDNVSNGTQFDCGAAGITITDARKELVDFSNPYFTSVQYVIFKNDTFSVSGTTADGVDYILWEALAGKKIGVQTNTTGHIYVDGEINGQESDPDYGYDGVLYGTSTELVTYSNAQVAVSALGTGVDVVVVDKLPAEYIVKNDSTLKCYALYYDEETATEEQYAICVTKGNTELLNAINEVLSELGEDGINQLVSNHLGLTN
ncbi:MAG: transporter substrate-binding domain-containing protein [Candidatus Coproplasma sp.]